MAELVIKLVNGELAGQTAQTLAKEVNAAALAAKKAEVGTQAWVDAHAKLDKAKNLQADLRKQITATTSASDQLKAAWNKLPGAQFFNQIGESFGLMKAGVGGLVTQFGVLRTAIAATGLGVLLLLLGSLVSYFTTTQEGIDKVTKVTRPLAAIFERLKGVVQELGGKVFKQLQAAIENPKQALKDLGQILLDQVINRFKAFALIGPAIAKIFSKDWKQGLEDLGNAALQVGTGVTDMIGKVKNATQVVVEWGKEGIAAGTRLDELTKAIERQEIALAKRVPRLKSEIKDLNFIVEDETATLKDREAAAEAAMAKQEELLLLQISLIDKKAAKMRLEQSLNDTSREQEKELAELEAKRFELSEQIVEARTTMRNKLNIIQKREADEEKKLQENIENLRVQAMQEGLEKQIEQINLETERKIEALTGSHEQILEQETLLHEIRTNAINALLDKAKAEQEEKDKKRREEELKQLLEDYDKRIEAAENYEAALYEIDQAKFDAAADIQAATIDLLSTDEASRKKHAKAIKALQVGSVTTSLAAEIQAIWEHANKNPANALFPGAGTVIAVVKTVAAAARAGAAIGRINSAKFAMGGLLKGPKHSQGGIPGVIKSSGQPIEMEGDEFIFSGKATRALGASNLIRMNDYLTRKLAAGGPVNPFQNRAPVPSGASKLPTTSMLPESAALIAEVRGLRADVAEWQRTLKVVNVATETEATIKTVNSIKAEADV